LNETPTKKPKTKKTKQLDLIGQILSRLESSQKTIERHTHLETALNTLLQNIKAFSEDYPNCIPLWSTQVDHRSSGKRIIKIALEVPFAIPMHELTTFLLNGIINEQFEAKQIYQHELTYNYFLDVVI